MDAVSLTDSGFRAMSSLARVARLVLAQVVITYLLYFSIGSQMLTKPSEATAGPLVGVTRP
jgi:hypothetical protein